MYATKLDGERVAMHDATIVVKDALVKLEVTIDGGKDSLSMVVQVGGEIIKAPCNLVINTYVICLDITKITTPDLKVCYHLEESCILFNLRMAL
jgi:phosphoribosylformylglycinamidine (FGAM) synthase-like enzyme